MKVSIYTALQCFSLGVFTGYGLCQHGVLYVFVLMLCMLSIAILGLLKRMDKNAECRDISAKADDGK